MHPITDSNGAAAPVWPATGNPLAYEASVALALLTGAPVEVVAAVLDPAGFDPEWPPAAAMVSGAGTAGWLALLTHGSGAGVGGAGGQGAQSRRHEAARGAR